MSKPEPGDIIAHCGHFYDKEDRGPGALRWFWSDSHDDGVMFTLVTTNEVSIPVNFAVICRECLIELGAEHATGSLAEVEDLLDRVGFNEFLIATGDELGDEIEDMGAATRVEPS